MKVKALKRHGYGGRMRAQGDIFYIDNEKHLKLLTKTGHIKILPQDIFIDIKEKDIFENISDVDNETQEKKYTRKQKKKESTYSRKDLTAEENNKNNIPVFNRVDNDKTYI